MRLGGRTYTVDWGHLAVATFIAGVCLAYLLDARATSLNVQNLLLVQPTAWLALLLYLLILPQCIRRAPDAPRPAPAAGPAAGDEGLSGLLRIAALAVVFGLFVFSLEIIGFDVAAWLFTALGLLICGERRPLVLLVFPLVFAGLLVLGYRQLIPYPFPTLFL